MFQRPRVRTAEDQRNPANEVTDEVPELEVTDEVPEFKLGDARPSSVDSPNESRPSSQSDGALRPPSAFRERESAPAFPRDLEN